MKKIFLAVAVVALLGLTACGDSEGCYEYKVSAFGVDVTHYYYGTKDAAETYKSTLSQPGITVTMKKVSKSKSDCTILN